MVGGSGFVAEGSGFGVEGARCRLSRRPEAGPLPLRGPAGGPRVREPWAGSLDWEGWESAAGPTRPLPRGVAAFCSVTAGVCSGACLGLLHF